MALWTAGDRAPFSKRQNLDRPKAPTQPKISTLRRVKVSDADQAELGRIATQHHQLVNSLFAVCRDDAERQAVLVALRDVTSKPQDTRAQTVWTGTIMELRSRK
ncbi:hypothetical protein EOD23_34565 [Mesorhizobium sp. USDA-HM6]|nr:hypothetical protein EOD23_34565 [Mesorhizobium sp. USDA-HM6]